MAKKPKIGILYSYDENWIGGAYYIQNLIKALNYLPKEEQISLYIVAQTKALFQELQKNTGYPNLKFINFNPRFNLFEKIVNKVGFLFLKKEIILKKIKLDWVFPLHGIPNELKHISKLIFWIPDLQEKFLPEFFTANEIELRHNSYLKIIASNCPVVFSSQAALQDFSLFYPNAKNKKYVLPFAVVHPDLKTTNIEEVKNKFGIIGDYFFSPNQFWQHKNQIAIIEAVKKIKEKGFTVKIVFSGKEYDYRNPEYTNQLKKKVAEYNLENNILFLGFIDRIDQLLLMKNAIAILQPSLFEGWSTVVEDAKALNQTLIVSDLKVHREQLAEKGVFFNPHNYDELATKMLQILNSPNDKIHYNLNYIENKRAFALNLKNLIKTTLEQNLNE